MSAREPRFEVVRTDDGYHARFRAANGRIILSSENYVRREGAQGALSVLFRVCHCAFIDAPEVYLDERTPDRSRPGQPDEPASRAGRPVAGGGS